MSDRDYQALAWVEILKAEGHLKAALFHVGMRTGGTPKERSDEYAEIGEKVSELMRWFHDESPIS